MLSIRQMKAMVRDHQEGREVPRWVSYVLEPLPAQADARAPAAAPRAAKRTLLGLQAPVAERWPATEVAQKPTLPSAPAVQPAEAAEETAPPARKLTVQGMQAPDGKDDLIRKLRGEGNDAERIAAAIGLAGMVADIDDRELLIDIAVSCNHKYLAYHVVEKLGPDDEALFHVACNTILEETAAHAFGKLCRLLNSIQSPEILTFIAQRTDAVRQRDEAAGKLAKMMDSLDLSALKVVALSAPEERARRVAVERLSGMVGSVGDVAALKIVAVYSEDDGARAEAVTRLGNCAQALKTVATCSTSRETRVMALGLLRSREDRMEIALNAIEESVSVEAVRLFADSEKDLVHIYEAAPRKATRDAAAACLCETAGTLSSVKGLKVVVLNGDHASRMVAMELLSAMVEGLDDRHALMYVGMWGTSWRQRRLALNSLGGDAEALGIVAETAEYEDSRKMALRLLSERTEENSGAD